MTSLIPSPLPPAARRALATLAVVACLAATTGAALLATRYLSWNWLSLVLAAGAGIAAVLAIGRGLDRLEAWVERSEREAARGKRHGL